MNRFSKNLKKEFLLEARDPRALGVSVAFALVASLSVSITSGGVPLEPRPSAIIFWVISYFCAMNSLAHIFTKERDEKTDLFLKVHTPPGAVYLSKLIYNLILFIGIETAVASLYVFFTGISIKDVSSFVLITGAGAVSLSLTTTVLAAMVARGKGRGALFTIISFPISLPILWVSVSATIPVFSSMAKPIVKPVVFLLAFSLFIATVSYTLFPGIWTEE